jgi:hypothetical protein
MKTEAVVLPHDPGWNEARVAWNLAVDPDDVFRSNHPVRLPGGRLREAA